MTMTPLNEAAAADAGVSLDSLYDMILAGGPLMIPIGLCSVVALAYAVERSIHLRTIKLGTKAFANSVLTAAKEEGAPAALALCEAKPNPLSRILGEALKRASAPFTEMEKAVEDAGSREIKRLSAPLRPLVVVGMVAPLLGLLGTVWGMIDAFKNVALNEGLGKPELLAQGISQALITTAAGLAIAIPAQMIYFYFRSRIDRFSRNAEDTYVQLADTLHGRS